MRKPDTAGNIIGWTVVWLFISLALFNAVRAVEHYDRWKWLVQ